MRRIASIRITDGNFGLLHRLLTQIGRVLEIDKLEKVTLPVVEVARESLVVGTAWWFVTQSTRVELYNTKIM